MDRDSDSYEQALAFARAEKFSEALNLLNAASEAGDLRAVYAIGTWFLHGKGDLVKQDINKGFEMIKRAAQGNIPEALYDTAVSYEKGMGTKKSLKKALCYYLKATFVGHAQSFHEVGRMFYYGIGVQKDEDIADVFLEEAEKRGVVD